MPFIEGTVEFVSVKELPQADQYGNTHRSSIKIGDDWFSTGSVKKPELTVKHNGGWEAVTKGAKVEFRYTENGNFKNVKRADIAILEMGQPQAPKPQSQGSSGSSAPAQGSSQQYNSSVNPAEIGQCMNLAAQTLGFTGEQMLDPDSAVKAIQWYKRSRQLFTSLYAGVDLEESEPKAPEKPKAQAEAPPFSDDDDI